MWMTVQLLKLKGERYVVLHEKDFEQLRRKARNAGNSTRAGRMTAQDRGDIAEATRRKRGPARPYSELRKKLGLA
jgi:hypothetical protein